MAYETGPVKLSMTSTRLGAGLITRSEDWIRERMSDSRSPTQAIRLCDSGQDNRLNARSMHQEAAGIPLCTLKKSVAHHSETHREYKMSKCVVN